MRPGEWDRIYGSQDRVRWVQDQDCIFCGATPCENAHVTNGGMGRKADAEYIVPACAGEARNGCHWEMDHGIGKKAMERKYRLNLREKARETDAKWRQGH